MGIRRVSVKLYGSGYSRVDMYFCLSCKQPHRFQVPRYIPPCSYKNQLFPGNLLGSGVDIVHAMHPCHRVAGFQRFCGSLDDLQLVAYPLQPVLRLLIQVSEVCPQLSGQKQAVIVDRLVFPQISPVHSSPLADGVGLLRQRQVWDKIITHTDIVDVHAQSSFTLVLPLYRRMIEMSIVPQITN